MITKAIIPCGGLGTRFLPATKAQPKEMLTVVDQPVIQYIVEETVASGIKEIILITGQAKRAIEDHFDRNFELEYFLKKRGKTKILEKIKQIQNLAKFIYLRQKSPLGNGDAVLLAKELIDNQPCAVLFGDDIIESKVPCLKQMIEIFEKYQDPVLAVMKVPMKEIGNYGVIKGIKIEEGVYQIKDLVEKPTPKEAPSNLAIVGRYILTPPVFAALEKIKPNKGEYWLLDAFKLMLKNKLPVYAYEFDGKWYGCGDKLGYLKANFELGLKHPEVGKEFRKYLKTRNIKTGQID